MNLISISCWGHEITPARCLYIWIFTMQQAWLWIILICCCEKAYQKVEVLDNNLHKYNDEEKQRHLEKLFSYGWDTCNEQWCKSHRVILEYVVEARSTGQEGRSFILGTGRTHQIFSVWADLEEKILRWRVREELSEDGKELVKVWEHGTGRNMGILMWLEARCCFGKVALERGLQCQWGPSWERPFMLCWGIWSERQPGATIDRLTMYRQWNSASALERSFWCKDVEGGELKSTSYFWRPLKSASS